MTLQEALSKGFVEVEETRDVNQLTIENKGTEEVFVQAGDVVKGGWQDRVLSVSILLAPKSGKVPLASFCVESGRWARRSMEDAARFSESSVSYSPQSVRSAMMDMASSYGRETRSYESPRRSASQRAVWDSVAKTQGKLERTLHAKVRAEASPSSLQLSMEAESVKVARDDYLSRLQSAGESKPDIVGVVFAINGKVHSAERYAWHGLFAKMWEKNLAARITEAVAEDAGESDALKSAAAEAFVRDAESGMETVHPLPAGAELRQRRGKSALLQEAMSPAGEWVHRTYLPA